MKRTPSDVARILVDFVDGTGGDYDWDDFISIPITDPALNAIRLRCSGLPEEFPPTLPGHYCNDEGLALMSYYAQQLGSSSARGSAGGAP